MSNKDQASKSKARQLYTEVAEEQRPPATKRIVPKKKKTAAEREAKYRKHGKPAPYRIHPDTIAAVNAVAKKHKVRKGKFVDVLLRQALYLLSIDRISLPIDGDEMEGFYNLQLPDLPGEYQPD